MKLLVAVEDPHVAQRAGAQLARCGYSVAISSNVNETVALLAAPEPPKLVVLGGTFAGAAQGLSEAARRAERERPYVLLYLDRAKAAEHTLAAGADVDDVLLLPSPPEELDARVRLGARIALLEAQAASARDWLVFAATHDAVTGALTRPAMLDALDRELARAARERRPVGVVALHVVDIEAVRATHGPVASDLLFHEVTCRARDTLRTYDLIGRGGSDSLVAILPGVDAESVVRVASRLRASIESAPFDVAVASVQATCRVGFAVAEGTDGSDSSELVAEAEAALLKTRSASAAGSHSRLRAVIDDDATRSPTIRVNRGALS